MQNKFPLDAATPLIAKKGQVVIFSYLLVHGSYKNSSDRIRRMLLFQVSCSFYGLNFTMKISNNTVQIDDVSRR